MYKALIIDDEMPVRQAITALGNWEEYGIDTLFEAVEGQRGLNILREQKPEIVLVDMKMPNMDGVEFLKIATEEFPQAKFIVISGYDDFEYTKQAIKAKVLDYLLKPVVESELNSVLHQAVTELAEERKQQLENIEMNIAKNISIPMAKEKIVLSMIENDSKVPIMEEYKKILEIGNEDFYYGIAILNVINFNEICNTRFNDDAYSMLFALTNVIDEMFSSWSRSFSFKNNKARNEIILVIVAPVIEGPELENLAFSMARDAVKKLEELFGVYCIAGMGRFSPDFVSINESFKSAAEILNSINILNCDERVFTRHTVDNKYRRESLMDKKELLIYAFESGSIEYTKNIINEYFDNIRKQGYLSLDDLYKIAMEFVIIVNNIIEHLNLPQVDNIIFLFRHENSAMSFAKLEDFSGFVFSVIEKVFNMVRLNLKASEKKNLYEIKDYIDKNYFREIKLNSFSDKYYLSKEYLSRLFKDEFGYSIYEYVLKVRMEKAREMIVDPTVKIQSISEHLGYKDNNYFSRAFKIYYGVSPSEYREREFKK